MITIILSKSHQRLLLNEIIMLEPELHTIISKAEKRKDSVRFNLSTEQLDDLLGHIAAESNHARSAYMEKRLNELYDRLEIFESGNIIMSQDEFSRWIDS